MDTTQTTPTPRPSVDALVFDAYGTLFDVQALTAQCEADWPGQGAAVSALWRGTQLEYSWLRSLMGRYADFERVTADALAHVRISEHRDRPFRLIVTGHFANA